MCSGIAKCTGSSIISHSNTIYGVSHSPHPSSRRSGYSTQRAQGGSPLRIGASYDYVPHQPTGMRETPYSRLSTPYGIALLIWKTSHPARFFLAFYSSYSSGTTPVYHGYSRDIHPPPTPSSLPRHLRVCYYHKQSVGKGLPSFVHSPYDLGFTEQGVRLLLLALHSKMSREDYPRSLGPK